MTGGCGSTLTSSPTGDSPRLHHRLAHTRALGARCAGRAGLGSEPGAGRDLLSSSLGGRARDARRHRDLQALSSASGALFGRHRLRAARRRSGRSVDECPARGAESLAGRASVEADGRASDLRVSLRFGGCAVPPATTEDRDELAEHFSAFGPAGVPFAVESRSYKGAAEVVTYELDELLGTELHALYQRRNGRDLLTRRRHLKTREQTSGE